VQVTNSAFADSDTYLVCKATNVTKNGFDVQCFTQLKAGAGNVLPLNLHLETDVEAEYLLINSKINATNFILQLTVESIAGITSYETGGKDRYWTTRKWYSTTMVEVYVNGVLVGSSDYAPIPTYPSSSGLGEGSTRTNSLNTVINIEAAVDSIDIMVVKIIPKHSYYSTSKTVTVDTLSFNSDSPLVVSVGSVLFIATTGATGNYSIIEGAAYGLRNQVR
jgi:hypothetical protein